MHFLVVDDDPTYRRFLQRTLKNAGTIDVASNGQEGLTLFEESVASGNRYDVVFLDITMPVLTGQDALTGIRAIEQNAGIPEDERTKVIMSTSHTDEANIGSAFASACNGYLVKPYEPEDVIGQLRALGFDLSFDL